MAHTPEPSDEPPLSSPTSESLPSQPNTPPDAEKQNPDKNDYAAIRAVSEHTRHGLISATSL